MKKQPWLEIAEYASLVGLIAGSVVAVISKQFAYASAPLAVALWLSLVNRSRLRQEMQEYTSNAYADVYKVVESLHQQVETRLNEYSDLNPIAQSISKMEELNQDLTNRLVALEEQFNAQLKTQTLEKLQQIRDELQQRLDKLASLPVDLMRIKAEVATLQARLQVIDLHPIKDSISQLQIEVNQFSQQQQDLPSAFDSSFLEQRLAELEQKNSSTLSDYFDHLVPVVKQLQSDKAASQSAIAKLANELNALAQRFDNLPTSPEIDISWVADAIAPVVAMGSIPEQIVQLQTDVRSLSEQIECDRYSAETDAENFLEKLSVLPEVANLTATGYEVELISSQAEELRKELQPIKQKLLIDNNSTLDTKLPVNQKGQFIAW